MRLATFYHHIVVAAQQTGREFVDLLQEVKELGITAVEVDLSDILRIEEQGIDFDADLKKVGMGISSIYGFYDFGNFTDENRMKLHVDTAKKLQCDRVMIIPGFFSSADEEVRSRELEKMLIAMQQMCRYAAMQGITPLIEDFDDEKSPISTAEQMLWFAERIPELRIAFDTGNFMLCEKDELEAYELLKDYIVHVHCKDRGLEYRPDVMATETILGRKMYPAAVGNGCIAMKEIVERLENSGYQGLYTIEHAGAEDQLSYIRTSVDWLKSCIRNEILSER